MAPVTISNGVVDITASEKTPDEIFNAAGETLYASRKMVETNLV
jgi:PleD family two-component response regulator